MARIQGGFNQVQAWGGESEALPPGEYLFEITEMKQGQSKNGNPQLEMSVKVHNEGELYGRGGKFWYTLNFQSEVPRKRLKSLIDATGVSIAADGSIEDQEFVGRYFMADVAHETYTVTDPASGNSVEKSRTRIQNERPVQQQGQGNAAFAASAPAPAAAPQQFAPPQQQFAPPAPAPFAPPANNARPGGFVPAGRGNPLTPAR